MLFGKLPNNSCLPRDEDSLGKHINDFNLNRLIKVLEDTGFEIEKIKSNGLITHSKLITKYIPSSMGETLIVKARKVTKEFKQKCPDCKSKNTDSYFNTDKREYFCEDCRCEWQINPDGMIIELKCGYKK
ncbi:unnamed protein product [marine sediment metagenome]|uniref:Uncharacterized protein n=1 Tax=marine sediment metagenome TaxID=412755 RepID=X0WMP5_9ZZZZ